MNRKKEQGIKFIIYDVYIRQVLIDIRLSKRFRERDERGQRNVADDEECFFLKENNCIDNLNIHNLTTNLNNLITNIKYSFT